MYLICWLKDSILKIYREIIVDGGTRFRSRFQFRAPKKGNRVPNCWKLERIINHTLASCKWYANNMQMSTVIWLEECSVSHLLMAALFTMCRIKSQLCYTANPSCWYRIYMLIICGTRFDVNFKFNWLIAFEYSICQIPLPPFPRPQLLKRKTSFHSWYHWPFHIRILRSLND